MNLFDFDKPLYKLDKNKQIHIYQFFGGYGSTQLAFEYLIEDGYDLNVVDYKLIEWNYKSCQAYKDIHFPNDHTDYSKSLTIEEIKQYLFDRGISKD